MSNGCQSVEPAVREFFYFYGQFCYRRRWPLFLLPIVATALFSLGFFRWNSLRVDDPAYVFTPTDARWKRELNVFTTLWPLDENHFITGKSFETKRFVNVLVRAVDNGDVLRTGLLEEVELLNQWIMNNITVPTEDGKYNLSYQDLCLNYEWECGRNEHVQMLLQRHKINRFIDLKFPKGGKQDTPVYLGTMLGDVRINESDSTVLSAKITQLGYFLKQEAALIRYSTQFSYAVERFLLHQFHSNLIMLSFAHYHSLQDGLDENANRFVPNFVVSFTALSVFALACAFAFRRRSRRIDWVRSKPWIAVMGLVNTLMAVISAFGFMMLCGISYNVINTIIPFLIIAIGIDDMFIMNACWETSSRTRSVSDRMSMMMAHAGVAVSITNITDILSFAIGCISELPGIQYFCSYACAAVAFCYFYQLTFFAGFMAIMGDVEHENRHCIFFYKINEKKKPKVKKDSSNEKLPQNESCDSSTTKSSELGQLKAIHNIHISDENGKSAMTTISPPSSTPPPPPPPPPQTQPPPMTIAIRLTAKKEDEEESGGAIRHFFGHRFGPFILRPEMRALAMLIYTLYIVFAIVGCVNFKEGLNPGNLVTNDHYIARYFEDLKLFWVQGQQLHVAVLDPPDLKNPVQREKLMAMVRAFEDTEYTMGRRGTVFFFLEYLNYLNGLNAELENTDRLWKDKLRSWLSFTGGSANWAADIVFNETDNTFAAYRFQVALKNIVEPNEHKLATRRLRAIADAQPFQVQVFYEAFPFADQYLMILPSTLRNIIIALVCMTIVALLLIPSLPSALLILVSIISINAGVFGYMTFWGVNLDAVSMISIIMSIGFAVDLSAHITYAFVTAHGDSRQRVIQALENLGWPIFQGASSTIVGVSVLYTVDAYIILTFFKTVWLTMVLGALHGLLFIPVALSFFPVSCFRIPSTAEMHP